VEVFPNTLTVLFVSITGHSPRSDIAPTNGITTRLNNMFKNLFLFIVGGILYSLIELLFRGYTHWLMFFVGGFCFLLVGAINNYIDWDMPFPKQ